MWYVGPNIYHETTTFRISVLSMQRIILHTKLRHWKRVIYFRFRDYKDVNETISENAFNGFKFVSDTIYIDMTQ